MVPIIFLFKTVHGQSRVMQLVMYQWLYIKNQQFKTTILLHFIFEKY